MTLPNFLIIGAAKSGTSALYRYLLQHPEMYMSPVKEPHFFGYEGTPPNAKGPGDFVNTAITDIETYRNLFSGVSTEKAIGEASPSYIHLPKAAERIRYYLPQVKLIAILRQPADRAYSAFMHVTRDKRENISDFAEAMQHEDERIASNWGAIWHYKTLGFYYEQLKYYYDLFSPEQIRVYLHDDLKAKPLWLLQDIFNFLNVDDRFEPNLNIQANVSGVQKSRAMDWIVDRLFARPNPIRFISRHLITEPIRWRFTTYVRNRNLVRQIIPPDIRRELTAVYREDILKLQNLLNRDLSHWLNDEV